MQPAHTGNSWGTEKDSLTSSALRRLFRGGSPTIFYFFPNGFLLAVAESCLPDASFPVFPLAPRVPLDMGVNLRATLHSRCNSIGACALGRPLGSAATLLDFCLTRQAATKRAAACRASSKQGTARNRSSYVRRASKVVLSSFSLGACVRVSSCLFPFLLPFQRHDACLGQLPFFAS